MKILNNSSKTLIIISFILLCFGLLMVYSSSGVTQEDSFKYFKKQFMWSLLGICLFYIFSKYDYKKLKKWSKPLIFISCILLVAIYIFSKPISGAKRWLSFGGINFQVSELAKISIIIFLADYFDKNKSKIKYFFKGLGIPLFIVGLICLLIAFEPDIGTPSVIVFVSFIIFFIAGVKITHLLTIVAVILPGFIYLLFDKPYRIKRILALIDPWKYSEEVGYQLIQSILSLGSGGIFGKGLGHSDLKKNILPAQYTDFIFSIIGEEMGLIGTLSVLILFSLLLFVGYKISKNAPDMFGQLLSIGLILPIVVQAYFNIAVCIGLLPTKGLVLPFISYGGSSLALTLMSVGILDNISKHKTKFSIIR